MQRALPAAGNHFAFHKTLTYCCLWQRCVSIKNCLTNQFTPPDVKPIKRVASYSSNAKAHRATSNTYPPPPHHNQCAQKQMQFKANTATAKYATSVNSIIYSPDSHGTIIPSIDGSQPVPHPSLTCHTAKLPLQHVN